MRQFYVMGAALTVLSAFSLSTQAQQTTVDYIKVSPANGATMKTFSQIEVSLPVVDWTFESQFWPNMEKLAEFSVTKDGEPVAQIAGFGEASGDEEGNMIFPMILSETIAAEGEYSFTLPEGLFAQMKWDDYNEDYVMMEDGVITAEYSAKITIDPNAKTPVDNYTLAPADGSILEEISLVSIAFPEIANGSYFDSWMFPSATFTNGETTFEGRISYDWDHEEDYVVMNIIPVNADDDEAPITDAGKWTLTIEAGTFTYKGDANVEITAEYTIGSTPASNTFDIISSDPANGDAVKTFSMITVEVPVLDLNFETIPGPDESKFEDAIVTHNGETVANVIGIGEMMMNDEATSFLLPLVFSDALKEAGEYTVFLPEGFIGSLKWDDDITGYIIDPDGKCSAAFTATVTVDPNVKTPVENFIITPADGSKVSEISTIYVGFPEIPYGSYFDEWDFLMTTFSNGETTIEGAVSYDWNNEEDYLVMSIAPINEDWDNVSISTPGKWTLTIPEGTFTYKGNVNPETIVVYEIESSSPNSINGVEAAATSRQVISIDGKLIFKNASDDQIKSLDKGIYVINGKKVVVK